jgi:hypothetical protein
LEEVKVQRVLLFKTKPTQVDQVDQVEAELVNRQLEDQELQIKVTMEDLLTSTKTVEAEVELELLEQTVSQRLEAMVVLEFLLQSLDQQSLEVVAELAQVKTLLELADQAVAETQRLEQEHQEIMEQQILVAVVLALMAVDLVVMADQELLF